jgi:hypothetical protein
MRPLHFLQADMNAASIFLQGFHVVTLSKGASSSDRPHPYTHALVLEMRLFLGATPSPSPSYPLLDQLIGALYKIKSPSTPPRSQFFPPFLSILF